MKTIWMLLRRFNHSHNVAQNCRSLSLHLGYDREFAEMAELMGYYHDMAAFDEMLRTHSWFHVEDHGMTGYANLMKSPLYPLVPTKHRSMFEAIRDHNKLTISDRENKFLLILRDADKLDIFRFVCGLIDENRVDWYYQELLELKFTPQKMCEDMLEWLNDINYAWTVAKLKKLGVVEKLKRVARGNLQIGLGLQSGGLTL